MRRVIERAFLSGLAIASVAIAPVASAAADDGQPAPLLHALFQDHAVLQREQPIKVWGNAAANDELTVSLADATTRVRADASGHWMATLPSMQAGGPYSLSVKTGAGNAQRIEDVLIGDVWLCSGQSNMVLQVHRALDSRAEIAGSANDSIRMLTVGLASSVTPLETFAAPVQWQKAAPATVPEFSATCYYFARELQKTTRVAMGLVNAAWGGSKIEAWMSEHAIREAGGNDAKLDVLKQYASNPVAANQQWGAMWEAWWRSQVPTARGAEPWSAEAIRKEVSAGAIRKDASAGAIRKEDWHAAPPVLDVWEKWDVPQLADFNGMVWYRASVKLSEKQAAQGAVLSLGHVDEVDQTWVNGRAVGYTSGPDTARLYSLPKGLLKAGENVIVVNALDTYGSGGLNGPAEQRALRFADGSSVSIDGNWQYQIAPSNLGPAPRAPWEAVAGLTTIHNAMIAPIGPYGFRGVVWYQGESNTDEAGRYQALLSGLMADWRSKYGADLPFLIVQLANYGPAPTAPGESGWASLREAQRLAVANDAHAGLAVAIDIGDRYDIHPANKQELGRRLARAARHVVYGEAIAPSGPTPASARREGEKIVVAFDDVDRSLVTYGADQPIGFELCGATQASCRYANAIVKEDRVELQVAAPQVPTRVRFCWADSPVCTLYDRSGLPAGPFEMAIE